MAAPPEIVADPLDMGLRWQHWRALRGQDPDRAELIRLQLLLRWDAIRGDLTHHARRTGGVNRLLGAHRSRWLADLLPKVRNAGHRGGFVEFLSTTAAGWLAHPGLREQVPLVELRLTDLDEGAILEHPSLQGLYGLNLAHADLTDGLVERLARSPVLQELRWLRLDGNGLGRPALDAVSAHLPQLQYLAFGGNAVSPHPVVATEGDLVHWIAPGEELARVRERFGDRPWMARHPEVPPTPPLHGDLRGARPPPGADRAQAQVY